MVLRSWVMGLVGMVRVWSWLMHYVYGSPQKDRSKDSCVCVWCHVKYL